MNERQKAFCDNYIINGGNAVQAALDAGYSEQSARYASKWIDNKNPQKPTSKYNPELTEYIAKRMQPTEEKRICSAEEVLMYLSSVVRREQSEHVVVTLKEKHQTVDASGHRMIVETETPKVIEVPAKLSDANKAAELLGKYRAIWDGQGKETTSNGILESLQALMEKRK